MDSLDSLNFVVEYVHLLRQRHNIIPGPSAKGLASEEYGEMGQLVFDDLVRYPDGTGSWKKLENPTYLSRAVEFVQGAIEWDAQHPPPAIPLAGLTKRVGNFVPIHQPNDK